jgi:heterodisulfide reductase subunit C
MKSLPPPAIEDVERIARTAVRDCYQCGKCSAGCPLAHAMDVLPNRLVRWVQLGQVDKAMRAAAVWQCVSCMTCSTRCPQSVDCAGVFDALRQLSVAHDAASPTQRRTIVFQRAMLENIRRNGRLGEIELLGVFKTRAFLGDLNIPLLVKDALLGPQMLKRGKLRLFGERVRDRGLVARIFERCRC